MSELSDKLDTLPITIESTHIRLRAQESNDNYLMDEWECTITHNKDEKPSKRSLTTSYKSGIGHRKLAHNVRREGRLYIAKGTGETIARSDEDAARAGYTQPVAPKLADVLACLINDASAVDGETFIDFCSNFGYDVDSRNALDIYLGSQRTLVDLRRVLGYDLYNALRQLEH